ncbi:melanoma antigen, family B, 5 [Cricetulus griseus]|uniref:Melanoma antigen, family B, 5 n=1 Tax=Cricetulus griseus TaxID=10029 RepID=A0A061I0U4_CRIGR|nr:melanoma antigen, family B, 5 [Cricetulus griseus]
MDPGKRRRQQLASDMIHEKLPASESSCNIEWPSCVPSPITICDDDIEFDQGDYCYGVNISEGRKWR